MSGGRECVLLKKHTAVTEEFFLSYKCVCGRRWDGPWQRFSLRAGRCGPGAAWKGLRVSKKAHADPLRAPSDLSRWVFNFHSM